MKKLLSLLLFLIPFIVTSQVTDDAITTKISTFQSQSSTYTNEKSKIVDLFTQINLSKINLNKGNTLISSGTNNYTATVSPAITSYTFGQSVNVMFANANTGTSTIALNGLTVKTIKKKSSGALVDVVAGDLGANFIYELIYDGTYFQVSIGGGGGGSSAYTGNSPTTVTVGGLSSGTNISAYSLSDVLQAIVAPYVFPVFNSFSVSQTQTVPVGTTISGSKTATWSISANSGVVSTMDIRDVTASTTLVAATPNDGTQGFTATTLQLNSNGASQTWRGIGNNSSPSGTFNSGDYTVTARYPRYYGPASARPTNSATVVALPINSFHPGASNFSFSSGTTENKLYVILPPSVTILSVIDVDASNANITAAYVLVGTVTVVDAGGTNRSYNLYEFVAAIPYSPAHTHSITTNN